MHVMTIGFSSVRFSDVPSDECGNECLQMVFCTVVALPIVTVFADGYVSGVLIKRVTLWLRQQRGRTGRIIRTEQVVVVHAGARWGTG